MADYYSGIGSSGVPGATTNSPTVTPMIANLPSQSTTTRSYDPAFERFMNQILARTTSGPSFNVPGYTETALQNLTENPGSVGNIAGQNFNQIAAPLLQAQQQGFKLQNQNLMDMFRRTGNVGSLQSGAFAQAARQQVNDQGQQQQNLIASNYVPLLNNATQTSLGSINAGLNYPGAQAAGQASLNQILGILAGAPRSTSTFGNQAALVPGGVATAR